MISHEGPVHERDRHVCHVLAHFMRGDGADGCFPSQRTLASAIARDHKLVGRSIARLRAEGWLETQQIRRQYGRKSFIYFPSVPAANNGDTQSPIKVVNGDTHPQSDIGAAKLSPNGEFASGIGEFRRRIGVFGVPRNLTEISLKDAASPSPSNAGSAAPENDPEVRRQVLAAPDQTDMALARHLRRQGHLQVSARHIARIRSAGAS